MRILITGGAGFVGSHLADELLRHGHEVRALDNLCTQPRGQGRRRPAHLAREVDLVVGDVRNAAVVARALDGVEAVVHLAAVEGGGRDLHDAGLRASVNGLGTAVLLEQLVRRPLRRLVVTSSSCVYGEGLYRDARGADCEAVSRSAAQLRLGDWEPRGADGAPLEPAPTPEHKAVALDTMDALTKYDQERLCLLAGRAHGLPVVALRLFNVYGPRQSPASGRWGAVPTFASALLRGDRPTVFEDGLQRRDYVSVRDVARAARLALERDEAVGRVLNVGSGVGRTVLDVLRVVAEAAGRADLAPRVTGRYCAGDVRHCFADLTASRAALGYDPSVTFEEGVAELVEWVRREGRERVGDRVTLPGLAASP